MVFQIRFKLRRPTPVADAPSVKAPLVHIFVAFVIHVPDQPVPYHEIGGKPVDVQSGDLCLVRHVPHLSKIGFSGYSIFDQFKDGGPFDVLLHDPLSIQVNGQHPRDTYTRRPQAFIIPLFRFDLVAEDIIITGLMVDLFYYHQLPIILRQVGISALAMAQQPEDTIWFPTDNQLFSHAFLLFHSFSPEIRVKETFPFA